MSRKGTTSTCPLETTSMAASTSRLNQECKQLMATIPALLADLKEGQDRLAEKIERLDESVRGNGKEGLVAKVVRLESQSQVNREDILSNRKVSERAAGGSAVQWWYAPSFAFGASLLVWFLTVELPKIIAHVNVP